MEDIIAGKYIPPRRVVHIGKYRFTAFTKYIYTCFTPYSAPDMKGAPPLPSYLATLLPVLAR